MRWLSGDPTRREQIVAAALACLATTPLERVTTREIAAAVGLSQPALFRHFRSREAILVAAAETVKAALEAEVEAVLVSDDTPIGRCLALARALAAYVERHPGLPRLLFADLALDAPDLRRAVSHLVDMQRTFVAELLRQARERGELREGVSPQAAAELFVGMMQGLALRPGPGARPLGERLVPVLHVWRGAVEAASRPPAGGRAVRFPSPPAGVSALRAIDARPLLARGADPLADILGALEGLAPGSALVVTAPFRPKPLERLLAGRGHAAELVAGDGGLHSLICVVGGEPGLVDLRALEAPEPMEAVLEATGSMVPGQVLMALVPRHPHWLLPHLEARGLRFAVAELCDGSALLRVEAPR